MQCRSNTTSQGALNHHNGFGPLAFGARAGGAGRRAQPQQQGARRPDRAPPPPTPHSAPRRPLPLPASPPPAQATLLCHRRASVLSGQVLRLTL
eukprot:3443816-Rhodomonas_salina.1